MVARSDSVPAMVRTVKVVPFLACDNAGYVLGRPKIAKDPSKQPKEDAAAVANATHSTIYSPTMPTPTTTRTPTPSFAGERPGALDWSKASSSR